MRSKRWFFNDRVDFRKVRLHPYTEEAVRKFCTDVASLLRDDHVSRVAHELPDRFTLVLSAKCLLCFPCPAKFRGLFYRELNEEFDEARVAELKDGYEQWLNAIS